MQILVGRWYIEDAVDEGIVIVELLWMVSDGAGRELLVQTVQLDGIEIEQYLLFVLLPRGVQVQELGDAVL